MTTTAIPLADPAARAVVAPRPIGGTAALGAVAVFLLLLQIASGILLSFYYEPTTEAARESVVYLMARVTGGWLVRSVHGWAAQGLLVALVLYLISVFFTRRYRDAGRWRWVVAVAFLGVLLGFRFSGDLLPYDQRAYAVTAVGVRMAGELPVMGPALQGVAFGGDTISDATLNRFHTAHILLLPWLAFGLGLVHLTLRRKAVAEAAESGPPRGAALLAAAVASILVGLAVLVSAFWPAPLGGPVTEFETPPGALPHWTFAGLHGFLQLFPGGARVVGYLAVLACWALLVSWPFVEARLPERLRDRASLALGGVVCCSVIALTLSAYRGS